MHIRIGGFVGPVCFFDGHLGQFCDLVCDEDLWIVDRCSASSDQIRSCEVCLLREGRNEDGTEEAQTVETGEDTARVFLQQLSCFGVSWKSLTAPEVLAG